MSHEEIAGVLKTAVANSGLTPKEVADRAGITTRTLDNALKAKNRCLITVYIGIAQAVGCELELKR